MTDPHAADRRTLSRRAAAAGLAWVLPLGLLPHAGLAAPPGESPPAAESGGSDADDDAGWVTLSGGETLDRWRADASEGWSAAGGVIVADLPAVAGRAELVLLDPAPLAEFELEFELAGSPGAKPKVRFGDGETPFAYVEFPDFAARPEWWGTLSTYSAHRTPRYARLNRDRPAAVFRRAAIAGDPDPETGLVWHRVRVRVAGRAVSLAVNGVPLGGATDAALPRGPKRVALVVDRVAESDGAATARFRSVRLRPLDPAERERLVTGANRERAEPAAEGQ